MKAGGMDSVLIHELIQYYIYKEKRVYQQAIKQGAFSEEAYTFSSKIYRMDDKDVNKKIPLKLINGILSEI